MGVAWLIQNSNVISTYVFQMKKLSRRNLLKYGSLTALGAIVGEAFWEPQRIETLQVTVPIKDLPKSFEGFRIGVLSDIHWGHCIDERFVHRAYDLLQATSPDLLVIPGDIYHGETQTTATSPNLKGVFEHFTAPYGVFGVLGNHDYKLGKQFVRQQVANHSPIKLIDNAGVLLEKNSEVIALGGVGDMWEAEVNLRKAFHDVPPKTPRILLSHNPDIAEHVADDDETRVDFQISGHTHGGQMVLPGIYDPYSRISQYGSKFNRGLVKGKRQRVFVSKGLARLNHMRFCALPDVACITLTMIV